MPKARLMTQAGKAPAALPHWLREEEGMAGCQGNIRDIKAPGVPKMVADWVDIWKITLCKSHLPLPLLHPWRERSSPPPPRQAAKLL